MIKLILSVTLLYSFNLYAGTETGNGGQGVYCLQNKEVVLFDYYEAQSLRGVELDQADQSSSYIEIARNIIRKVNLFDPIRAYSYTQRLNSFLSESSFVSNSEFKEILDSNSIILPKDCKLVQVAVQKKPMFTDESYYFIHQDYWDMMSDFSKAGLILHEIIYREDISFGSLNSDWTRYFNSIIASSKFLNYQQIQYNNLLKSSQRLPIYSLFKNIEKQELWFFSPEKCYIELSGEKFQDCGNLICSKQMPKSRIVEQTDVYAAYPNLGISLKEVGLLPENYDKVVYQIFNKESKSGTYVGLSSEKYQFDKNQTSIAQGTLCIFTSSKF